MMSSEVPTASRSDIRISTKAGTIRKPPPTPTMPVSNPTNRPPGMTFSTDPRDSVDAFAADAQDFQVQHVLVGPVVEQLPAAQDTPDVLPAVTLAPAQHEIAGIAFGLLRRNQNLKVAVGANPQLSIYAFAARIASGIAGSLV